MYFVLSAHFNLKVCIRIIVRFIMFAISVINVCT